MNWMQIEEDHNNYRQYRYYVSSYWEYRDVKESEWIICSRQKENNPTEESTDYIMKVWETNLELIKDYKKRLQDQGEKILSLVLGVSIVIKITEDYQETVNKNKAW
jgi:hypothetical protein